MEAKLKRSQLSFEVRAFTYFQPRDPSHGGRWNGLGGRTANVQWLKYWKKIFFDWVRKKKLTLRDIARDRKVHESVMVCVAVQKNETDRVLDGDREWDLVNTFLGVCLWRATWLTFKVIFKVKHPQAFFWAQTNFLRRRFLKVKSDFVRHQNNNEISEQNKSFHLARNQVDKY